MIGELFRTHTVERNPEVVMHHTRGKPPRSHSSYITKQITGILYRVQPRTAEEMIALRKLKHEVEKFAPAEGDGVLITPNALLKIQS
jgi:hypothetical protein